MKPKLQATMAAVEKARELFDVKGTQAQVTNTLHQWIQRSSVKEENGDDRIFENLAKNVLIVTDRYTNLIKDVMKIPFDGKNAPLFKGQYKMTEHADERSLQRFGISGPEAESYFNSLLLTAIWHSSQGNRQVYDHKSGARIVVEPETETIRTVYKREAYEKSPVAITVGRIANAVKREFKRYQREVTREVRKLSEQVAIMHAEAAQLNVNKIRCRAPHTQLLIQARIDDILTQADELAKIIDVKLTEIERAKDEVGAVIGE